MVGLRRKGKVSRRRVVRNNALWAVALLYYRVREACDRTVTERMLSNDKRPAGNGASVSEKRRHSRVRKKGATLPMANAIVATLVAPFHPQKYAPGRATRRKRAPERGRLPIGPHKTGRSYPTAPGGHANGGKHAQSFPEPGSTRGGGEGNPDIKGPACDCRSRVASPTFQPIPAGGCQWGGRDERVRVDWRN